jgi:hypothetical protein
MARAVIGSSLEFRGVQELLKSRAFGRELQSIDGAAGSDEES